MSRNIKEIGKELLGKSLNSFHRKTGLTQLEKNNEMQDGILDGILSQVDDAYIEKTEQSNVIHLEGSGDGVVVLDNIEGNTMVNLLNFNDIKKGGTNYNCLSTNSDKKSLSLNSNLEFDNRYQYFRISNITLHSNKEYTFVCNITKNTFSKTFEIVPYSTGHTNRKGTNGASSHYLKVGQTGIHKYTFTMVENDIFNIMYADSNAHFNSGEVEIINPMILEGDWSDKEIPASYFEGLQSSFEDKVEEDKYEIEILSKNRNMIDLYDENILQQKHSDFKINSNSSCTLQSDVDGYRAIYRIPVKKGRSYTLSANISDGVNYPIRINDKEETDNAKIWELNLGYLNESGYQTKTFIATKDFVNILFYKGSSQPTCDITNIMLTPNDTNISFKNPKSNKIKLLINEPLRAIGDIKDKLCVKDNKLVIERNCGEIKAEEHLVSIYDNHPNAPNSLCLFKINQGDYEPNSISNKLRFTGSGLHTVKSTGDYYITTDNHMWVAFDFNTREKYINYCKENNIVIVSALKMPYYEEVLNEYGEPIILEGYENGTIYIDSTIVPTTTVRYTPKMESFKTLNEVSDNNTMLANDINDNIIPYMMDVDLMIMEKEMALPSQINIRKMEVLDMTSMQKRTQDMLERLIKGKTLTEQECKTRVAVYLNAGKITDAQAEELNFLIDEIYA